MKTLNKINLTSSKADERKEAAGLINAIKKFTFMRASNKRREILNNVILQTFNK